MADSPITLNQLRQEVGLTRPRGLERARYEVNRRAHPALLLAARIRSSTTWARVRVLALTRDRGLCLDCRDEGRTKPAEDVDHVVGLTTAPWLAFDLDNLRSLCRKHHTKKEAKVRAQARRARALPQPKAGTNAGPAALAQATARGALRVLEGSLGRLKVDAGDVLVVMSPRALLASTMEHLKEQLATVFPGHRVLVLEEGLTLGAITPDRPAVVPADGSAT